MPTPPRLRRYVPPTPEELAEQQARVAALQAQHASDQAVERAARRAAIEAGPVVSDVESAVRCACSCHPRPGERGVHDGGTTCPCQQTPEQRRAALDALFATRDWADDEWTARRREQDEEIAAAATALDVEVDHIGGIAPFVIAGRVDGRGFYLRERHQMYRIVVAPDTDPTLDMWSAPTSADSIEIASGHDSDLDGPGGFDPVVALRHAVAEVRLFLLRRHCAHDGAIRFCPTCGIAVEQAAAWREIR